MLRTICFLYVVVCVFSCKSQDRRTKEQQAAGDPEPLVWTGPDEKSILDSVAAPKLITDTIQFRREIAKFLSFVNNEPRTDSVSFYGTWIQINNEGGISIRSMSGSHNLELQLARRMPAVIDLLKFEPAYMLKVPGKKVPFSLDFDVFVEKDIVRVTLTGDGGVRYLKAYLPRPLK